MALFKHRVTRASIPDGLMNTSVDLVKGMLVGKKLNTTKKEYEVVLPTAETGVYGFVTLRDDEAVYRISHYDKIEAGKKVVVYTLVKDNEWRTDQYTGVLEMGDKVCAGVDGKLKKVADGETAILEVIDIASAMAGYEFPTVTVKVL